MAAFAVKHLVADHGPLSSIMKKVKQTPFSYSSKEHEATEAARGNFVYVIEVKAERASTTYWLGYKYRAEDKFALAGGRLWEGEFKFKNSAIPGESAVGAYFDAPVRIDHAGVQAWLASKQPGMAQIPPELLPELDSLIANPANGARMFV